MTLVLLDAELDVDHWSAFLHAGDTWPDMDDARAGQVNGLCGAAVPGALSLTTGLNLGAVPIRIEWHESEPTLDDVWEDVVEVSFEPTRRKLALSAFEDFHPIRLPRKESLRVRMCAIGMDAANEVDVREDGDPAPDRYLVQLWPAPPAPDAVLRRTSEIAEYWHGVARETPPPPTAAERAEAKRLKRERKAQRRAREQAASERYELELTWGPVPPSARHLALAPAAQELARVDRELADAVLDLDPESALALAVRVCRGACDLARPVAVDWAPALDALQRSEPLPPPFDDPRRIWEAIYPRTERSSVVVTVTRVASRLPSADPGAPVQDPRAAATSALLAAADQPTPAEAALAAIAQAVTAHQDRAAYLGALRAGLSPAQP